MKKVLVIALSLFVALALSQTFAGGSGEKKTRSPGRGPR